MSSMIGAFDAKTHLAEALDRVERREALVIEDATQFLPAAAVDRLRALRQGVTLGDFDWRELREAGRR